jgi:primary-amine oxidase
MRELMLYSEFGVVKTSSLYYCILCPVFRIPFLRPRHMLRLALLAVALSTTGLFTLRQVATIQAQSGACTTGDYLEETLPTGARWDLCWTVRSHEGIVLSEIHYSTPAGLRRKVLQEASLSQIEVIYDDGAATFYYASEPGLGDARLLALSSADCPDGVLLNHDGRPLLCKQTAWRGYLYKYYSQQRQGDALTLFSASQIGQRLYIVQWRLLDNGAIEPLVGDGGRLLRQGRNPQYGWPVAADGAIGIGYVTNYWWRLDFDIGGNGPNDIVEELEVNPDSSNTQRILTTTPLGVETGRTTDPELKRSWRVRDGALTNEDGHAISYHLDPKNAGYRYSGPAAQSWNQHDFYVTVAHPCEQLAADNPTTGGCADNVTGYVNGESTDGADIVLWYRVTAHRLPRAEDAPLLSIQGQGFQLLPRDWTAQNPF